MNGPDEQDDVVELGRRRRLPSIPWRFPPLPPVPRIAIVLTVAGLVIGLGAGWLAGVRHGRDTVTPRARVVTAAPAPAPEAGGSILGQTGNECSIQDGRKLQLGLEVVNGTAAPMTLYRVVAVLPLGGMKMLSENWGTCGQLAGDAITPDNVLAAGATGWFTVTVAVTARCPMPDPVQFTVNYSEHGRPGQTLLPGFPDLSQIHYTGCAGTSAARAPATPPAGGGSLPSVRLRLAPVADGFQPAR